MSNRHPFDSNKSSLMKDATIIVLSVIGGLLLTVFIMAGEDASKKNTERRAQRVIHLTSLKVEAEPLTTKLSGTPASKGEYVSGGKVSTVQRYWTFLETENWVFLNGNRGAATCYQVLSDFAEANAKSEVLTPEQMDVVTAGLQGQSVQIWAHVPRFTEIPQGLENCWGYGFDREKGLLTIGSKPVAFIARNQPGLKALALKVQQGQPAN